MSLVLIQAQVLSASAPSVTFSAIPQTFKMLKLVVSARSAYGGAFDVLPLWFNGSGGTAYSDRRLEGDGSAATSGSRAGSAVCYVAAAPSASITANTFGNVQIDIPDYAGGAYKAVSADGTAENNATSVNLSITAALWASTAPITSLTLGANIGPFIAGSTFYLYGLS